MSRDHNSFKTLTRRALLIGGAKSLLVTTLLGRMYYLQVIQSDKYKTLADENRISIRLIPPSRGEILDRNGMPLATNRQNYQLILIPEQAEDVKKTLQLLSSYVPLTPQQLEKTQKEIKRSRPFMPIMIRDTLTWDEVAKIEVNSHLLSGLTIEAGQTRFYPLGSTTSHVVGYVGAVSEDELTGDKMLELPEIRIGKTGLEKVYDEALRGKAGTRQVEVNAYGRVIRELSKEDGRPGKILESSIDVRLQDFAFKRMKEESGSVVLMDIKTGELLAMVSTPSFDPNLFNFGLSPEQWKELSDDPKKPLMDKSVHAEFSPGSTFKMMTALAALEKKVVAPSHGITCYGHMELGNHVFHCWRKGGHGPLTLIDAIAQSCDVYFYNLAKETGIDAIAAMARRFGLGQKVNLGLPGEKNGLIPDQKWKRARFGEKWQLGETLVAGIGQGYVLTTPIQLATMAARIVNGGYSVQPTLLKPAAGHEPKYEKINIKDNYLGVVREGMYRVVNNERGTAFSSVIQGGRDTFGGKTGTAQVRRITMAERLSGTYDPAKRPWAHRDHALFVGYAPVDNPRFAISVIVQHGLSGSKAAAPVARDVLWEALKLYDEESAKKIPGQEKPEEETES